MSTVTKELAHELSDQPVNPLRNHQVAEYQAEAARLRDVVSAPAYVTGANRGDANKRFKDVNRLIETQAAKPLTGDKKDKVARLVKALEQEIVLLPREEMRRNPAGSVGRFLKHENSKENQQKIQQWKRAQLALEQGNPDPDLANAERLRPEIHHPGQAATFMANAQIPGQFAMSTQAKENWPLGEPKVETPLKQAVKREQSEAQKAGLLKAQAAARAKREAQGS